MPHLLAVDGSNTVMRCFYGYPSIRVPFVKLREQAEARGEELTEIPEELVERFFSAIDEMLGKLIREQAATHLVFCKDSLGPTKRHQSYEAYKGTRERRFPGSGHLISLLEPHLDRRGILHFRVEGEEADDLLGSMAKRGRGRGSIVTVVSEDNDVLQLVSEGVRVLRPDRGNGGYLVATPEWIMETYGHTAEQVIAWKVLRGDSSDNIPAIGIPSKPDKNGRVRNLGISEKKARDLLARFGTLEAIFAAAEVDPQTVDANRCVASPERERLLACREHALFYGGLVKLNQDVCLDHLDAAASSVSRIRFGARGAEAA